MKKGIFCISIDLELLWGRKDLNREKFVDRTKKERQIIKKLLASFQKYKIPATWAVVGKLFEKEGNPLWHAPDIVADIKKSKLHEIASHSYLHSDFIRLTRKQAEDEIEKCIKAAQKEKVILKSFVFPRNKIAHLKSLKKFGITVFRGKDKRNWELLVPSPPPVYEPYEENGLINIPGSLYFVSSRGIRKFIPSHLRRIKGQLGINKAISQRKIFHLWFHPVDFADNSERLFEEFEKILAYAAKERAGGRLKILTLAEIAKLTLTNTI